MAHAQPGHSPGEAPGGAPPGAWAGPIGLARDLIRWWALAGGLLLLGIVLLTAVSAAGNLLFNQPIPGDFEIVEVGVAIAAFCFLPYCQITGANVTADIFTAHARPRTIAGFSLLASLVMLAVAVVLLWRMSAGMGDYREYEELTPITGFPIWMAFPPILLSLVLLALAGVVTALENLRDMRRTSGR